MLATCRHQAKALWASTDADDKAKAMQATWHALQDLAEQSWEDPALNATWQEAITSPAALIAPAADANSQAGRPAKPELVSAKDVPTRSPFTPEGRAALLHAICHIEFNAINLALDAVWRFEGMPGTYYRDWLRVAGEEAFHFSLLRDHLELMGYQYGDFAAHDGLWAMCQRTSQDILARMALVPRTLEARGLDATPPLQEKLRKAGDHKAVDILDIILRDEIGHVAIGNRWFNHLCHARGLNAQQVYPDLVRQYEAPKLRPPYNMAARLAAGFTDEEMRFLLGEAG